MATIEGTYSDETLSGTSNGDVVLGLEGDDTLYGYGGNDTLLGGEGYNTLYGGAGADIFMAEERAGSTDINNTIMDFVQGTDKIDVSAFGISSLDQLQLILEASGTKDTYFSAYYGTYNYDFGITIKNIGRNALKASDFIFDKQVGRDVTGTGGDDRLFGSTGAEMLDGRGGNDQLFGGNGNDTLLGGEGYNTLYGGAGADIFMAEERAGSTDINNTIMDFVQGTDKIDVSAFGISSLDQLQLILEASGTKDTYFSAYYSSYGYEFGTTIKNIGRNALKASDFIFDKQIGRDVTGTGGDDRLFGSTGAEMLDGRSGNDQLFGGNGNDTLLGGRGYNTLYGGAGADIFMAEERAGSTDIDNTIMDFVQGTDKIDVSAFGISSLDQLQLILEASGTKDTYFSAYYSSYGYEFGTTIKNIGRNALKASDFIFDKQIGRDVTGTGGDDRLFGSTGAEMLDGRGGNDQLFGGSGNDMLYGGGGNDWLYGEAGDDIMIGGYGQDVYFVTDNEDVVDESAGDGIDEVRSTISLSISYSSRVLGEIENLTLLGSGAINGTGNGLANVITGNTGNNILDGKAGADTLTGGKGNDTYIVDNAGDKVIEKASEGTDLIKASLTYTLATYVENLTLTGSGAINGTGNSAANAITGNAANNILDGKAGADTLTGGKGNDTYIIDNVGDKVIEKAGEGTDLVKASVNYTLTADVENLTLTGSAAISGTGNSVANVITGNTGNNILDGKAGADTLNGGEGNDTYVVDNAGDKVVEKASEGTELVKASVSYTLAANVENLTLTGSAAINGTGNSAANVIIGNAANNILNGGLGNDILTGGAGKDTFFFNTALSGSNNVGRITDFVAEDDTIYLENAIFKALTATGKLASSAFAANVTGTATDAKDRIVYETDTGKIFYDADGSGNGSAFHFATLSGKPTISVADFFII
nr:calcium-binding protein [Shinella sp. CPCC 101442]